MPVTPLHGTAPRPLVGERHGLPTLALCCMAAAVAGIWFLTLDARHLLPSDEGRYAEIAREMFSSGDWVTIRYNGLKYFEKPPFHMWMTALAYHAFGVGDWQARLWVAVSGAVGLGVTMLAAQRWFGLRVAAFAGLVLVATPTWNITGHFNSLDMSVSGALACVLAGVLMAQHPLAGAAAQRRWMLFAWGAMGVATLTKGLIGIALPGLVLVLYTLIARDWALWRRLHITLGIVVLLLIAAPWFVLVSLRNPEFPQFFFVQEHWQRYTSTVHHRTGAWWYFIPQLIIGFLPWLGLSWRMVALTREGSRGGGFRPILLLAVWAAAIFVFFSLSGSKLPGYIVPIFPALAILAAVALDKLDARRWNRQLLVAAGLMLLGMLASPLLGRVGFDTTPNALYRAYVPWVAAACALAAAGGLVAYRLSRSGQSLWSVATYALAMFCAITVALLGHEIFGRSSSGVDIAAKMQAVLAPDMPIYSVRMLDHTVPFYLGRTTIMVESPDELDFGTRQEPQKWLPTLDAFVKEWSAPRRALALMSHDTYDVLRSKDVAMTPVAEDARRVVVANFELPKP
jgi:4-amino-4-deoxy-L-arabinose transferase-like glycosyltransferase